MVEAEFASIWQQVLQDKEAGNLPPEDAKKSDKKLQEEYRKIAERRVRLGPGAGRDRPRQQRPSDRPGSERGHAD
jgi:hypothetical protein